MKPLHGFLTEHPDLLSGLPKGTHDAYLKICGMISHLRSRKSTDFFIQMLRIMEELGGNPLQDLILRAAIMLSSLNWALVQHYFRSVKYLPQNEEILERWTLFALSLADLDIEMGMTFLKQTPAALDNLGLENLQLWGDQAMEALQAERRIHKAAKAYLEESVADHCAAPLLHWRFLLDQAARIVEMSPSASDSFIRFGSRLCFLLNDHEAEQWVTEGLKDCGSEEELVKYFSGTSQKALEKRDGLASGIVLKDRSNTLSLICEALLGKPVGIRSNRSLIGIKGFTGGAATDGRTIYLPDMTPSFRLFKLMALHQSQLLDSDGMIEVSGKGFNDLFQIHLDADRKLLERMPGLFTEMEKVLEGKLPESYPSVIPEDLKGLMPWWGDFLPELVTETEDTLQRLMVKAEERYDLPPEVTEALLSNMIAEGQRDDRELWERLQKVFDNLEFASPDAEELRENFKTFFYKEWDMDLSDYKLDWCLVRQRIAKGDPNPFVEDVRTRLHGLITLIRRQFMRLKPERFKKFKAQPMGDALDIDAQFQAFVEMRAGYILSDNV